MWKSRASRGWPCLWTRQYAILAQGASFVSWALLSLGVFILGQAGWLNLGCLKPYYLTSFTACEEWLRPLSCTASLSPIPSFLCPLPVVGQYLSLSFRTPHCRPLGVCPRPLGLCWLLAPESFSYSLILMMPHVFGIFYGFPLRRTGVWTCHVHLWSGHTWIQAPVPSAKFLQMFLTSPH